MKFELNAAKKNTNMKKRLTADVSCTEAGIVGLEIMKMGSFTHISFELNSKNSLWNK